MLKASGSVKNAHKKGRGYHSIPLRGLRDAIDGCSVGWLAEESGVDRQTIYKIIHGRRGASLDAALSLARVLGTTVESLVGEANECPDVTPAE